MTEQLELHVANLDCDQDAARLRRGLQEMPGIADLQILPKSAKVRVTFDASQTNAPTIEAQLRGIGFPPQPLRASSTLPRPR